MTLFLLTIFLTLALTYPYSLVHFSRNRGFCNQTFLLNLSLPKRYRDYPASINYTIAFNENQFTNAFNFGSANRFTSPINISRTCVVNAIFFNSTFVSNVTTHTYIFPADVITQTKIYKDLNFLQVSREEAIKGKNFNTLNYLFIFLFLAYFLHY